MLTTCRSFFKLQGLPTKHLYAPFYVTTYSQTRVRQLDVAEECPDPLSSALLFGCFGIGLLYNGCNRVAHGWTDEPFAFATRSSA
jgi:hypothetical protein